MDTERQRLLAKEDVTEEIVEKNSFSTLNSEDSVSTNLSDLQCTAPIAARASHMKVLEGTVH